MQLIMNIWSIVHTHTHTHVNKFKSRMYYEDKTDWQFKLLYIENCHE